MLDHNLHKFYHVEGSYGIVQENMLVHIQGNLCHTMHSLYIVHCKTLVHIQGIVHYTKD